MQGGQAYPYRSRQIQESTPCGVNPSVMGPESFPHFFRWEDRRGLPLRWAQSLLQLLKRGRAAFQKFISFAVLLPESFPGGCSFGAETSFFERGTISPAKDHVLARTARLPADCPVNAIVGGGHGESTRRPKSPKLLTFFAVLRCPKGPKSRLKHPKSGHKAPVLPRAGPHHFPKECDGRRKSG
jgi:hypothetical protein